MNIKGQQRLRQSVQTQTQDISPSSYIPKTSQPSSLLTLPKQFYFHEFALYCTSRGKHSQITNYQTHQSPIKIITSIQQFYEYFLSIKKPSQLPSNSKMMLFYRNCKPFWEEWLESGCLLIKFKDNKEEEEKLLDVIWQFLCYAFVGNNIDVDVIGVSLCKKEKISVIEIWLKTNDRAMEIGSTLIQQIRKQLPSFFLPSIEKILKVMHKRHIDSINTNSTIKGAQDLKELKVRHRAELNNSF